MFLLCLLCGLYFLPTIIAAIFLRKKMIAVFLLNLFTGWTAIGWIASLVYATMP